MGNRLAAFVKDKQSFKKRHSSIRYQASPPFFSRPLVLSNPTAPTVRSNGYFRSLTEKHIPAAKKCCMETHPLARATHLPRLSKNTTAPKPINDHTPGSGTPCKALTSPV